MSKISPQERWWKYVMERYAALKLSGEVKKLRTEGLKILKRDKLFTPEEWNKTFTQRASSEEYRVWYEKCRIVGERFGLAQSTVELSCLLKGYKPEEMPFIIESDWPQIRIITEVSDPVFLTRLAYEAQRLGTYVVQRQGSVEVTQLYIHSVPIAEMKAPPMPSSMPPINSAFTARVETPIGYPPEGKTQLNKKAVQIEKELLSRLGYSVSKRLRNSPLVSQADNLKMDQKKLPSGGSYDIIDKVFKDDLNQDPRRRKLISNRRFKLRKRLIEPYDSGKKKSTPE